MPKRRFATKYASKYANARNLVAGVLGRSEPDALLLGDIDFVPYSIVGHDMDHVEGGNTHFAKSVDAIPQVLARVLELVRSEDFPYECDGVVVRVAHEAEYTKLGATAHAPVPNWLEVDRDGLKGRVIAQPKRDELVQIQLNEQLVVELYSK